MVIGWSRYQNIDLLNRASYLQKWTVLSIEKDVANGLVYQQLKDEDLFGIDQKQDVFGKRVKLDLNALAQVGMRLLLPERRGDLVETRWLPKMAETGQLT